MEKIYLASPFFNKKEKEVKERVLSTLCQFECEVIDPQGGGKSESWEESNLEWGKRIFLADVEKIRECDLVIAIDWGLYGDCGTAWEIGFAHALNKEIIVVIPTETLNKKHSLMIANCTDKFISEERFLKEGFHDYLGEFYLKGVVQQ